MNALKEDDEFIQYENVTGAETSTPIVNTSDKIKFGHQPHQKMQEIDISQMVNCVMRCALLLSSKMW